MKFTPNATWDRDEGMVLIEFCDGTRKAVHTHEALTLRRLLTEIEEFQQIAAEEEDQ